MNQPLSDAQLHQKATALAAEKGIAYSEALARVSIIHAVANAAFSEPETSPIGPALSDADMHNKAVRFAAENGVTYSEALSRVAPVNMGDYAGFSENFRPSNVSPTDHSVHLAASTYMQRHGVSYSEALEHVAPVQQGATPSASEDASAARLVASDARIDSAATAYASAHGVSYSEALDAVIVTFREAAPLGSAAATLGRQPIEVFRAGTQIDNSGRSITFSQADLNAIARSYNPAKHEAPLTLGHPVDDKPAYGWVQSLHATPDGRLMMQAKQVDAAFAEAVKQGRFKKRSAAFYLPQNPNNPSPGTWYLKHVAWLGSMAPAVKGMPDVGFSAGALDGLVSFEF